MTAWGLGAYRAITRLVGGPVFRQALTKRVEAGKEDPHRLPERRGEASVSRPDGVLIWLHAASVGESLVAMSLAEGLVERDSSRQILITSGTQTSAQLIARRAASNMRHQYVPADNPAWVRRFLDHWRPDLAVFTESELWPNLVLETAERGVPVALANARMNDKSLNSWRRWPHTAKAILSAFDWIGAADGRTAAGLGYLLDREVTQTGNLKLEAGLPEPDADALQEARNALGARPVFTAASTHEGEESTLIAAHTQLLKRRADALMILAPRHPERADDVGRMLAQAGLSFTRRSSRIPPDTTTQVWIADTLGEMPLWYGLSPVTVVCGSFLEAIGGHNPIEVTRAGSAVVTGPFAASFAEVYAAYDSEKARAIARTPGELAAQIDAVWSGKGVSVTAALRALETLPGGARAATLDALDALLAGRTP
jgi:3-deoxy-D-manno-octulosonic-acid transferase